MFGELMTKIEKLETGQIGNVVKKGEEARKEKSVARNSVDEVKDDLYRGNGFCTHRGRGMRNGKGGDIFDHLGILSIKGILMIWGMQTVIWEVLC